MKLKLYGHLLSLKQSLAIAAALAICLGASIDTKLMQLAEPMAIFFVCNFLECITILHLLEKSTGYKRPLALFSRSSSPGIS